MSAKQELLHLSANYKLMLALPISRRADFEGYKIGEELSGSWAEDAKLTSEEKALFYICENE